MQYPCSGCDTEKDDTLLEMTRLNDGQKMQLCLQCFKEGLENEVLHDKYTLVVGPVGSTQQREVVVLNPPNHHGA